MSDLKSTKIECICETCKKSFFVKSSVFKLGTSKFCSRTCRWPEKIKVVCEICESIFFVNPSRFNHGTPKFCSRKCRRDNGDLSGQKFGRWTVISRAPNGPRYRVRFNCACKCGTCKIVDSANLISGSSVSCGCYNDEVCTRHGHASNGVNSSTYHSWKSMISRCNYKKNLMYSYYGGRGISVCERWKSFENFLEDMGEKPNGLTLDRFPNQNGNYEKSNCRWATHKQQSRNMRNNRIITFNGESRCIMEWSEITGINVSALYYRIRKGWSDERTLTKKVKGVKPCDI